MKLETIYNELVDIIKNEMDFTKALKLKEKLEQAIRQETCYKTTSKTRVNAIKRVASKWEDRPALTGYGVCGDYKIVTDSYHAIMIKEDNMPLKLVTTDKELADKVGHENCINANYPLKENVFQFNKEDWELVDLDYNDIEQFYKLHKKNAEDELYDIKGQLFNIIYLKNIIDVLGADTEVWLSKNDYRPLFVVNKNDEVGLVLPCKKY